MGNNPKLTVLFEKLRGKVFEIEKDETSIGRKEINDICLKDGSLSGHHADIIKSEVDGKTIYTLRDADSTNGTRVNNIPVTEQVLKNADLITFGSVEVLFDSNDDDNSENTVTKFTHTIDLSSIESTMSTTPTLGSLNPLAVVEEKKHVMVHRILIAISALLGLGALAAVIIAMIKIFSK